MIGPENASPDPGGAGRVFKWGTRSTKEFELHAFANDLRAMTAIIIITTILATSLTNPFFILSIRYSGRSSFIFFEWVIQVVKPVHN